MSDLYGRRCHDRLRSPDRQPGEPFTWRSAQFGIYVAFLLAMATGLFTPGQAAAIGIIGGADGPTAIYIANNLAPELVAPIAVAAYSYMA